MPITEKDVEAMRERVRRGQFLVKALTNSPTPLAPGQDLRVLEVEEGPLGGIFLRVIVT